uniref:Protein kinase domain-containing protein n=1 Tax=Cucumis sativus TaxID=3659 RepID=A0A0A0LGD9_CUCSA
MSMVLSVVLFMCIGSYATFTPIDNYLISCGSTQNITFQGRTFVPDSGHSLLSNDGESSVVVNSKGTTAPSPIYQSARVFTSIASYKFEIRKQGRHWVRLYFYPIPKSERNLASASITVVTEKFVLLNNFTFKNYNGSFLFKEYAINVTSDSLILTFIPSNGSVSFVNAIEVVSVPDELIPDQALALNPSAPFSGISELAFETVYRLNMGGPLLTSQNDTLGRSWENDMKYLHVNSSAVNVSASPGSIKYHAGVTPETAPNWVYATADAMGDPNVPNVNFNLTWVFSVEPSFQYFVRVHFCDIMSKALNNLVFNLYINSDNALGSFDLSSLTGDLGVPYYKDFISNSADSSTLTVSVGPDTMADITNATMNGLEIMKISNQAGSLDGTSSVASLFPDAPSKKNNIAIIVGSVLGAVVGLALIVFCYCCFVGRKSKTTQPAHPWLPLPLYGNSQTITKVSTTSQKSGTASFISLASSSLGRFFTFQEILDATNKFDENLLLGVGGFGRVYKGTLEDGMKVAVKRGNPRSEQGLAEFRTEIEMLSKLRHRHLVSLIGYCDERSEMILVYEYMANGPLRSHLYGTDLPPRQQLTEKSDVYSFGVVLMEVLCTRPALNPVLPREQVNIAEWAMTWQKKGMLDHIMDPNLVGKVNPASLKKFGETAEKCLAEYGVDRPSMGDVLWNLEYALQLEETSSALMEPEDNSTNHIPTIQLTPLEPFDNSVSMIDGGNSGTDDDAEDAATSAVFSQLVNPRGR